MGERGPGGVQRELALLKDKEDWFGSRTRRFSFTGAEVVSSLPQPIENEEAPPGGAATRVEERPVMTLPQFWLEPLAYAFMEVDMMYRERSEV